MIENVTYFTHFFFHIYQFFIGPRAHNTKLLHLNSIYVGVLLKLSLTPFKYFYFLLKSLLLKLQNFKSKRISFKKIFTYIYKKYTFKQLNNVIIILFSMVFTKVVKKFKWAFEIWSGFKFAENVVVFCCFNFKEKLLNLFEDKSEKRRKITRVTRKSEVRIHKMY